MTIWKSYVRKSAVYTAEWYSCSEILSENGEKYRIWLTFGDAH